MTGEHTPYVLCVSNDGYLSSLEPKKIYETVEDAEARKHQMMRIIDESGEDYLYPASLFVPIRVPRAAERLFSGAA